MIEINVNNNFCRGLYNPAAFTRLSHICRDCFNLFKVRTRTIVSSRSDPSVPAKVHEVYSMCMDNCFASKFFMHCAKLLLLDENKVTSLINDIGKK